MKNFLFLVIACLLLYSPANAVDITFKWDANTEPDLAGYKIYKGAETRNYIESKDVGNVTVFTWEKIEDGTHFFAATAYDEQGNESDYSNELTLTIDSIPPGKPQNFELTVNETKSVRISVE